MRSAKCYVVPMVYLVLCFLASIIAGTNSANANDVKQLTVEQTLALVSWVHGGGDAHLYRAANRDAKSALYRILADTGMKDHHARALGVLGYIADADDVDKIMDLLNDHTGTMSPREQSIMQVGMMALGVMSSRGIDQADAALQRMCRPAYWRERNVKWYMDQVLQEMPERRYQLVYAAIFAYAAYAGKNVEKIIDTALADVHDLPTDAQERFASQLSKKGFEDAARERRELEAGGDKPITDADRARLNERYMQYKYLFTGEKPRAPEAEEGFVRASIEEATFEYGQLKRSIERGDIGALEGRVLDNGRIPDPERIKTQRAEFEQDLKRQAEVFKLLEKRPVAPLGYTVVRTTSYDAKSKPQQGVEVETTKTEEIVVSFTLPETSEITKDVVRGQKGSLTIAKDGSLIVVMKKIDGKWYWNPFGW